MTYQVEKTSPIAGIMGEDLRFGSICSFWSYYNTSDKTLQRLWCNTWRCSICAPFRARAVRDKFIDLGKLYELNRFLTLTINPKLKVCEVLNTANEKNLYMKKAWLKFRMNLKKQVGDFQYLWVMEWHKKEGSFPHLHVMLSTFIPKNRLTSCWNSAGGGFLKIKRAKDDEGLARYCCKYMSKDVILSVAPLARGTRIWGRSRGLRTIEEMVRFLQDSDWILIKKSIEEIEENGEAQCEGENLETTCRAFSEQSTEKCCQNLEAQITEN